MANSWLRRIRNAALMALAWGLGWAPLGVLAGMILDPDGAMDEPWLAVGAYPGLLSGALFYALLAITSRRRRLDELSPVRAGAVGALSGMLAIVIPTTVLLGTPNTEHLFWRWRLLIIAAVTLLGSVSALGTVLVAKAARKRALRDGSVTAT